MPAAPPPQQAPAAPGPGPSGARIVFHPPQASREPAGPVIHAVRPGDSLYRIVELSYGRWSPRLQAAVAEANGLADPSRIHPGQELELPVVEGFPPPRPN